MIRMIAPDSNGDRDLADKMAKVRENAAFSYIAANKGEGKPATFTANVTVDAAGNIIDLRPFIVTRGDTAQLIAAVSYKEGGSYQGIRASDLDDSMKERIRKTYSKKFGLTNDPTGSPKENIQSMECDPEII